MQHDHLLELVGRRLTVRQIARELGCSFTNVRYWLKKCGISTRRGPHGRINRKLRTELESDERRCGKCGEEDPTKFYGSKRSICGRCHNEDCIARGDANRDRALAYLGARCSSCGFDRFMCALDVHHVDAGSKDAAFSSARGWSWNRLKRELRLCVLLCKNCHAAHHAGELELKKTWV